MRTTQRVTVAFESASAILITTIFTGGFSSNKPLRILGGFPALYFFLSYLINVLSYLLCVKIQVLYSGVQSKTPFTDHMGLNLELIKKA